MTNDKRDAQHQPGERLLFAPSHSAAFAQRVAAAVGAPLASAEEREFEGGEHKMRPLTDVHGRDVFVIQSLCGDAHASANDKLCRLLFFCGALRDAGTARVTICIPYLAYARKDRRTQPNDPVTTRYVAALVEAVGVNRVVVLDVHNEAAFDNAFRCETVRIEAVAPFTELLARDANAKRLVVASPDVGGVKRAQRLREALERRLGCDIGFAFMEKRRALGVVAGDTLTGDVADCDVLLYDDIIASGGTVLRAAQASRRAGARSVRAAATHAVFSSGVEQLLESDALDAVIVSDSIELAPAFTPYARQQRVTICSVAPLFAATIERLVCHTG